MAKIGKSAKIKGHNFELEIARKIREKGVDKEAKRALLSGATWAMKEDIYTSLPFIIECKAQEKLQIYKWWRQVSQHRKPTKDPVLIFKSNNKPTLVAMDIDDWLNLLKELQDWKEASL